MADVVYIVVIFAFFALCIAYVRGLDRMVRAGDDDAVGGDGR